jgi:prefoldin subunit 5
MKEENKNDLVEIIIKIGSIDEKTGYIFKKDIPEFVEIMNKKVMKIDRVKSNANLQITKITNLIDNLFKDDNENNKKENNKKKTTEKEYFK